LYRDKKVVGVFIAFSCAASLARSQLRAPGSGSRLDRASSFGDIANAL
jgi:hypothetical protein